jgi:hypothetical protein
MKQTILYQLAFAHVVVGDTAAHTQSTWENDITLAREAGLALRM